MNDELVTREGGCHCGAVRFEVDAARDPVVYRCNCSICILTDYLHLIVPATRFRLLKGRDALSEYRFNTGVAKHYFCGNCGIKSFYVPRSNPDGVSVNFRCLAGVDLDGVVIEAFDGRHWEDAAGSLAHLSRE